MRIKIKGANFAAHAIDGTTPTVYSVMLTLSNVVASNNATSVTEGSTYSVTLTPASGYNMDSVTVMHNGQEVTPTSGYTYTINNVSGNIIINASAVRQQVTTYTVTYDLSNVTSSNNATSVEEGSSYSVTLTPRSGYNIDSVTVTHNGMSVTPSGSDYTYNIGNVRGNIVVRATATQQQVNTFHVTYNLSHVSSNNSATIVNEGANYSFTLTPDSGYSMDSVSVTHDGNAVSPTSGNTFNISNVSGDIVVNASATEQVVVENKKLTVLGKYGLNVTATQGESSLTTSDSYQSANGGELDVLTNTDVAVSATPSSHGETVLGLLLNGSQVTSPIRISADSLLTPRVKGNLAYVKYSGGKWGSSNTVVSNSVNYRTEIMPVVKDEPLKIKVPNHPSQTVKIYAWYCSCNTTYNETYSVLTSIPLDANCEGTITPPIDGHFALNISIATDGDATVFSTDDAKGIEVNYANTSAWSIPAFKWEQVLDLGAVTASGSNVTWNQSAALYNNYMLTFSTTMYRIKVINLETMQVVATISNDNKQTDIHANSACFLPKKYDESDFYPLLMTNVHGAASDKLTIFRLAGTTATSFSVTRVCDWTIANNSYLDMQVNGNIIYLLARSTDAYYDIRGMWRVLMNFNDSSIYVDREIDLAALQTSGDATRILPGFYQRTGQDVTLITQSGKDDIFVNSYGPTTNMPTQHAGMVFYRVGSTSGSLIGWLPTNRILNDYEHDGIVYAGNGVLYCVLVNSNHAYLYRFTITIPEYST